MASFLRSEGKAKAVSLIVSLASIQFGIQRASDRECLTLFL